MANDDLDGLEALPDVLTIRELARVLRCSESTIKRRLRAGVFPIPPLRGLDKRMRFAKASVLRYLDSGARGRAARR
ncbi:MAG: helix-turn-helix domain-containing protein [Acidobacteria bacterium]|jgi:excisionase family DNA binding protein|nr:helix-turn-helix domain-containing protein [Acidobacteriota bacterium]